MNSSNVFKWKACFDPAVPYTYCPEKLKLSIQQRPDSAYFLLQVLKGEHYKIRNYIHTVTAVIDVFGGALDQAFDVSQIISSGSLYPMMTSQFGKDNDIIMQATGSDGEDMDRDDNVAGNNLMNKHINDKTISIIANIPKQLFENSVVNSSVFDDDVQMQSQTLSMNNSQISQVNSTILNRRNIRIMI